MCVHVVLQVCTCCVTSVCVLCYRCVHVVLQVCTCCVIGVYMLCYRCVRVVLQVCTCCVTGADIRNIGSHAPGGLPDEMEGIH